MRYIRRFHVGLACAALALFFEAPIALCQVRTELSFPNVGPYSIMRCDFHMHTVFSDGNVWPTVRVEEAWVEGLDALALTDHIEYTPHKDDVKVNFNRSYELAKEYAKAADLRLLRGAEITRALPQGHYCTLFIKDAAPLKVDNFFDAIKAAIDQGAFVVWNHPSFQNPKGICEWFDVQTQLLAKGWMHGIEVVNGREYYPESHRWCLEKKLTMLASSDSHDPTHMDYDVRGGEHRPMTLVLVKERNSQGIKDALFARRTIVYTEKMLIGEAQYLEPLFKAALAVRNPTPKVPQKGRAMLQLTNTADVVFELVLKAEVAEVTVPRTVTVPAHKTALLSVRAKEGIAAGTKKIKLPYTVKNLLVAPEQGLPVTIDVELEVQP